MSESGFKDNRIVDLIAAILTGFGLLKWDLLNYASFDRTYTAVLQSASIRIGSLVFAASLLFLWKHRMRAQYGWIAIALLGLIVICGIDEYIYRATVVDASFFPIGLRFPLELIIFSIPTLLMLGFLHYAGLLLSLSLERKERDKWGNAI